jgi:glycosyltransferase involved in cell wall biosynthesis
MEVVTRWCEPADVSVIVPAYNCADTIVTAIESVLAQTALPGEIVIADDASSDATLAVVRDGLDGWNAKVPTQLLPAERNQGPSAARNRAMDAASRGWLAFLDADDFWFPYKLEAQCRVLDAARGKFSFHPMTREPAPPPLPANSQVPVQHLSADALYFWNRAETPTVIVRNTGLRFDTGRRYGEDHDYWLRYMRAEQCDALWVRIPLGASANPPFHRGGLSGDVHAMMRGQLHNIWSNRPGGLAGSLLAAGATGWSLARYARRLWVRQRRDRRAFGAARSPANAGAQRR